MVTIGNRANPACARATPWQLNQRKLTERHVETVKNDALRLVATLVLRA
jgi:hypothetical protein